jgi:hypothetical protein
MQTSLALLSLSTWYQTARADPSSTRRRLPSAATAVLPSIAMDDMADNPLFGLHLSSVASYGTSSPHVLQRW